MRTLNRKIYILASTYYLLGDCKMFKEQCDKCDLEVEGYTQNQVKHMLRVHSKSRHKKKQGADKNE